jgi:hypothetical protein
MVVGNEVMRILILFIALTACSQVYPNNQIKVFDSQLNLKDCTLEFTSPEKSITHNFSFENKGTCRITTHANTSVAATHFINGAYIFFVENNYEIEDGCNSEYTAIAVHKEKGLLTTPLIKRSGSCLQSQELSAFEYFSHKLQQQ